MISHGREVTRERCICGKLTGGGANINHPETGTLRSLTFIYPSFEVLLVQLKPIFLPALCTILALQ